MKLWGLFFALACVTVYPQAQFLTPDQARVKATGLRPHLSSSEISYVVRAAPYIPSLKATLSSLWPDMEYPASLAAQVEKESFWNPHAELCVPKPSCSREYGFGFGQFTITKTMNVFTEIKGLDPRLKDWSYSDRFNTDKQLIGIVAKDRLHYRQCMKVMNPGISVYACGFSSYNGGFGGVLSDRRVCSNTQGCDPQVWFGNVENTSLKAKVAQKGYGESFFQINRGYVRALLFERPRKYSIFPGFDNLP